MKECEDKISSILVSLNKVGHKDYCIVEVLKNPNWGYSEAEYYLFIPAETCNRCSSWAYWGESHIH